MSKCRAAVFISAVGVCIAGCDDVVMTLDDESGFIWTEERIDEWLQGELVDREFDGRIEEKLVKHLGRPINAERAELGRLLFFDPITSLTEDNSCSGCH